MSHEEKRKKKNIFTISCLELAPLAVRMNGVLCSADLELDYAGDHNLMSMTAFLRSLIVRTVTDVSIQFSSWFRCTAKKIRCFRFMTVF